MRLAFGFLSCVLLPVAMIAQVALQPGFQASEYQDLLEINTAISGWKTSKIQSPSKYKHLYTSAASKLDNQWSYWKHENGSVGVIAIRGTTGNGASWLENFYAAMIPAHGVLHFKDGTAFSYHLADREDAAVHTGWTIGLSYIADSILLTIREEIAAGVKQFYLTGHSQGGAITYLLAAWLKYQSLPEDVQFKVYCSAAPKPGNTGFAYDFEFTYRDGWAFNVINEADWVPEVPFSLQTIRDYNPVNPFTRVKTVIRQQKIPVRWVLRKYYNDLNKSSEKAQRKFQKRLGKSIGKIVLKNDSNLTFPQWASTHHYVRTGAPIILKTTPEYQQMFTDSTGKNAFIHHSLVAYQYLLHHWYQ